MRRARLLLLTWLAATSLAHADLLPGQYQVTTGDSFAHIAHRFGVSVKALRDANPNVDDQHLGVGAVLNIPTRSNYAIATGDTLTSVAQQHGVAVDSLRVLNHLSSDRVPAGVTLAIPPPQAAPPARPAPPPLSATSPVTWVPVRLADGTSAWAPRETLFAPSPTPLDGEQTVALARKLAGTPYVWGGDSPNGADCSGFVQLVYAYAGHSLPRTADVQYTATREILNTEMRPGDLVFFETYCPGPSHVGIYVGEGRFIQASSSHGVTESSLSDPYYAAHFLGVRRLPEWMPATAAAPSGSPSPAP